MFTKILTLGTVLLGLTFLTHCGSGTDTGLSSTQKIALIKAFDGLDDIEKSDELVWTLRWTPIDDEGIIYSIYKAPEGEPFNFNSPLITTSLNLYRYKPTNVFSEGNQCFIVRISNGGIDENENSICIEKPKLTFDGITSLERTSNGGYIINWAAIPLETAVYAIYQRDFTESYDFILPTWDAISENFQTTDVYDRGEVICFVVRYSHPDLPEDTNTKELCTEEEDPIDFAGITTITANSSTSITVTWNNPNNEAVDKFIIYNGSEFTEEFGEATGDANSYVVNGLAPGRQYSVGVRAADVFDRPDRNLSILSIVMPTE